MKKINVWLVDDELDLGELFNEFFGSSSVEINYYDSPIKALSELSTKPAPDVFFIDYRMPHMDGDQLAKKLPEHIPKYLITGELEVTLLAEFKGVIIKPYNLKVISDILNQINLY